jgi:hypothetical protein
MLILNESACDESAIRVGVMNRRATDSILESRGCVILLRIDFDNSRFVRRKGEINRLRNSSAGIYYCVRRYCLLARV